VRRDKALGTQARFTPALYFFPSSPQAFDNLPPTLDVLFTGTSTVFYRSTQLVRVEVRAVIKNQERIRVLLSYDYYYNYAFTLASCYGTQLVCVTNCSNRSATCYHFVCERAMTIYPTILICWSACNTDPCDRHTCLSLTYAAARTEFWGAVNLLLTYVEGCLQSFIGLLTYYNL